MGTNFYVNTAESRPCETCGVSKDESRRIHIGKSSVGWTFLWHGYRDEDEPVQLVDQVSWYEYLAVQIDAGGYIEDQYGQIHSLSSFLTRVVNKRSASRRHSDVDTRPPDGGPIGDDDIAFHEFS